MRFYRNHYQVEGGSSGGYEWFTNKNAAERAARAFVKDYTPLNEDEGENEHTVAEPIEIGLSRGAVLDALNRYAAHASNG